MMRSMHVAHAHGTSSHCIVTLSVAVVFIAATGSHTAGNARHSSGGGGA
jgi:hypothetical protein